MLISRGGALGALLLVLTALWAAAPAARAQQPVDGVTIDADVELTDAGLLRVDQKVQVPANGQFHMVLPLRVALPDDGERRFTVTDISATGTGTAKVTGDLFTADAAPGSAEIRYTVHGSVSDAPGTQIFHWTGALNTDVASITASVISPSYRMGIASCRIGPPGHAQDCADVRVEPDGTLHLHRENLHRGDTIDLTLQLPPGTVPANADYGDSGSRAFALTAPVLAAFGVLLAALAVFGGYLLWVRRQDTATTGTEILDPVQRQGDSTEFASPEGVLPGEAGVVADGRADTVDLAATLVDLAVRRYLWVRVEGESDWRIGRVNAPDAQLHDYETALYRSVLPDGTESVLLSELRTPGRVHGDDIRATLLRSTNERGLLADRTARGPVFWLGAVLVLGGIAATVALAVASGPALVGVAVALAGVAAILLPRLLPARTPAGRALAGRLQALRRGLDAVAPEGIPPVDRELLFSRALPFTVVSGRADHWIRLFRDLDPSADRTPGLYWFGGFERDRDLHRFASHFPYFITSVEGVFASKTKQR